jgi:hypothetical protein
LEPASHRNGPAWFSARLPGDSLQRGLPFVATHGRAWRVDQFLPRTTSIPLLRRLPVLATSLRALLVGPGSVAQLVVEVCELVAEIRYPFVKIGRLLTGVCRGRACTPRLGGGPAGTRLCLAAQLL